MDIPSHFELALLQKLKLQIKDLDLSEEFLEAKNLVRWLRARRQSLENAEKMIRKSHEWYVKNDVDTLMESYESKLATEYPVYFTGFDNTGSSVTVVQMGKWDVQKTMASGHKSEFTQYILQILHLVWLVIKKQSESRDYMTQVVGIYDFQGLTLRQVTCYDALQTVVQFMKILEANYPEILKRAYIVNAPWAFQILYRVVKPIMDERTHSKFVFLGSDPQVWREEISKNVPLDQFPKMYGGSGPDYDTKVTVKGDGHFNIS